MVTDIRLLDVIVDDNLTWTSHVDSVCAKIGRKKVGDLRSFPCLDLLSRRLSYLFAIHPDLENASAVLIPSMPVIEGKQPLYSHVAEIDSNNCWD